MIPEDVLTIMSPIIIPRFNVIARSADFFVLIFFKKTEQDRRSNKLRKNFNDFRIKIAISISTLILDLQPNQVTRLLQAVDIVTICIPKNLQMVFEWRKGGKICISNVSLDSFPAAPKFYLQRLLDYANFPEHVASLGQQKIKFYNLASLLWGGLKFK